MRISKLNEPEKKSNLTKFLKLLQFELNNLHWTWHWCKKKWLSCERTTATVSFLLSFTDSVDYLTHRNTYSWLCQATRYSSVTDIHTFSVCSFNYRRPHSQCRLLYYFTFRCWLIFFSFAHLLRTRMLFTTQR